MTIDDITNGLMILVRLGISARFIFCMVKLIGAEEEALRYKKRAKNAVLFWIIAESVWLIKDIVLYYYAR
jgi:hypothetical protein